MFSCDICDYQCKQKGNLKQHKQNKHDIDVKWKKCDLCDYQCKQLNGLLQHKKNKHSKNLNNINWKYKKKYKYKKSKYYFIGEKEAYQRLSLAISQDLRFQKINNPIPLNDDITGLIGNFIV